MVSVCVASLNVDLLTNKMPNEMENSNSLAEPDSGCQFGDLRGNTLSTESTIAGLRSHVDLLEFE